MRLLHHRNDHVGEGAARPHSAADEAEVRAALDGNLCRCGTHGRIIRAVLRAAQIAGRI